MSVFFKSEVEKPKQVSQIPNFLFCPIFHRVSMYYDLLISNFLSVPKIKEFAMKTYVKKTPASDLK